MYARGRGVAQDHAESVRWFRAAAQQGDAAAQTLLGLAFLEGRGLTQDYAEAVRWFRLAARQRYLPAQFQLGLRYELGQGVARDLLRAYLWFNLAATEGDPASVRLRDRVAARLSPRELESAQRLARGCFEGGLAHCD
jgi:TPR repeat protein